MLKMITDKGTKETHVLDENTGRVYTFKGGHSGLEEALHYVSIRVFHALVDGKPLGVARDNRHPVKSLIPPVKKTVVNFYDLGEEAV